MANPKSLFGSQFRVIAFGQDAMEDPCKERSLLVAVRVIKCCCVAKESCDSFATRRSRGSRADRARQRVWAERFKNAGGSFMIPARQSFIAMRL
jgi:hypothetical protein